MTETPRVDDVTVSSQTLDPALYISYATDVLARHRAGRKVGRGAAERGTPLPVSARTRCQCLTVCQSKSKDRSEDSRQAAEGCTGCGYQP